MLLLVVATAVRYSSSSEWFDWPNELIQRTSKDISQYMENEWKKTMHDRDTSSRKTAWIDEWLKHRGNTGGEGLEKPESSNSSTTSELVHDWISKVPYLKKPWGRDKVNSSVGSDFVDETKDSWKPSKGRTAPESEAGRQVDVTPSPFDDIENHLLPAHDLLEGLRCKPSISFTSCVEHCVHLLPRDARGYSLSKALMTNSKPHRRLSEEEAEFSRSSILNASHLTGEGDRTSVSKYMPNDPFGFGLRDIAQLKGCMMFVCSEDYLKRTIPGCLDSQGNLVTALSETRRDRTAGSQPESYDNLDFYDPGRLELWYGLGLFTLHRWWYEIVYDDGLLRLLILPSIVLILLSLPILLLVLVVPGLTTGDVTASVPVPRTSRLHASTNAMDFDDYQSLVNPSASHWCEMPLARSKVLSSLKSLIDLLTMFSEVTSILWGSVPRYEELQSSDPEAIVLEMRTTNLQPSLQEAGLSDKKKVLPGTSTTLPSTGKTLPSPHANPNQPFL